MALSDKKILEALGDGSIIITPYDERNLATSSYDVTLGDQYFTEQQEDEPGPELYPIYNIYNKDATERVWGSKPQQALRAGDILPNFPSMVDQWAGIDKDDKVILIGPGETILAHTQEFIGGKDHITTMMKSRSSMGRQFIAVCKCAGWGDVGYVNRWTMEITNYSSHYTIPLVVGRRIAQIVFFETGPIREKDYTVAGKYQTSPDILAVMESWKPEDMLPKLYKDRDIKQ